jgi:hypothetical protein
MPKFRKGGFEVIILCAECIRRIRERKERLTIIANADRLSEVCDVCGSVRHLSKVVFPDEPTP